MYHVESALFLNDVWVAMMCDVSRWVAHIATFTKYRKVSVFETVESKY